MSRAFDKGYEMACNTYEALELKDWHSIAYAYGWIYGLECLIENYLDTPPDEYTTQEELDESVARTERHIKETQKLIDQIEGGTDHKNQIQALCKKIEELNNTIKELEE